MAATDRDIQGRLRVICGTTNVVSDAHTLAVYAPGAGTTDGAAPLAVALPGNMTEAAACVAACVAAGIRWRARGAGTWLPASSGEGAAGTVTIALTRMRQVLAADPLAGVVRAEAGLPGHLLMRVLDQPQALGPRDAVATLGGLLATPQSEPPTLGGRRLRVLALTLVLRDGELAELHAGAPGYDLLARFLGSAGAFGIAVDATVALGAQR